MKISFFQWHFGNFLLSIRKFGVRSSLCNFMLLFLFPLSFRRVKKGKLCCVYHKKVAKCLLTKQTYIVYRKLVKQTWKCFVLSFCVPIQGSKIKVRQSCQVEKKNLILWNISIEASSHFSVTLEWWNDFDDPTSFSFYYKYNINQEIS